MCNKYMRLFLGALLFLAFPMRVCPYIHGDHDHDDERGQACYASCCAQSSAHVAVIAFSGDYNSENKDVLSVVTQKTAGCLMCALHDCPSRFALSNNAYASSSFQDILPMGAYSCPFSVSLKNGVWNTHSADRGCITIYLSHCRLLC